MIAQLSIHELEPFTGIFKALSDETRVRILYLLLSSNEPVCVCELVDSLEEPQYNISRHLQLLKNAGLVEEKRIGRWKYYSATKEKDSFINHLFQTISSIPKNKLTKDYTKLKKRLEKRKNGECILGIQNLNLSSRR